MYIGRTTLTDVLLSNVTKSLNLPAKLVIEISRTCRDGMVAKTDGNDPTTHNKSTNRVEYIYK